MTSFEEWIENRNIKPIELKEKSILIDAIQNIERSSTGRADLGLQVANTFIMESSQLLVNAIHLFELGYFDCAFYSLREAIEISTTIVYLSDMPSEEREKTLEAWKSSKEFPMQSQMILQLCKKGEIFTELKVVLEDFFKDIEDVQKSLNKFVHKQGFNHFYVSRNHMLNQKAPTDGFSKSFLFYFKKAVATVAIMRLAIDPYPILLMDDEIRCKVTNSMTEPYTEEFVSEYIGDSTINSYKHSDFYTCFYDQIMQKEKINPYTFDVIEKGYIDTTQLENILSQEYLLDFDDYCAIHLIQSSTLITKIYLFGGWKAYFTNRKSNRPTFPWDSASLFAAAVNTNPYNQPYDEALISTLVISKNYFFIEHNDPLSAADICSIEEVASDLSNIFPDMPYPDPDKESILSMIENIASTK